MKRWLATQLRRMLVWLGEESDLDYRGRMLNVIRLAPRVGTTSKMALVRDLEETLKRQLPVGANWKLDWDLKDTITIRLNHRLTEEERERAKKGTRR